MITRQQAYAIEVRMQEIFEARGIEAEDWPLYDDEVRAQAHKELGIPMSEAIAVQPSAPLPEAIDKALVGDLSELTPLERSTLYMRTCESLGLNPLTKPFEYLTFQGKMRMYATRNCTDQLRVIRQVNLHVMDRQKIEDLYVVTVRAQTPDGRQDEEIGAVPIANLRGDALANAMMKAMTKAKRRVTLSIAGLSYLDESEVESLPGAVISQDLPSPDDPYLTRLEEQKEMEASDTYEATAGYEQTDMHDPPRGHASTAAQASAALAAAGMPSPNTTPITSKKPATLKRPDLLAAIKAQFVRLAGTDQQLAHDICRDIWGKGVSGWKMVESLTDASLRTGLAKLVKKSPEQPPAEPTPAGEGATSSPEASSSASAEEDVPTYPPPDGNPQEGPQLAPGSTQVAGFTQGAVVDSSSKGEAARQCPVSSKTGIRCVREVRDDGTHDGEHSFVPERPDDRPIKLPAREQVIVVPDPDTGVRYVSGSDGMTLREFCRQHDLMEFFTLAVDKNSRNLHGNVMITERQYWQMRAFAEAQPVET